MLTLKTIIRKNPLTKAIAYYPTLDHTEPKDFNTFVDEIVQESTLTRPDVVGALSALEMQIIRTLRDGMSIRLGDLGSFHLTAETTGQDAAEDVTSKDIKALHIQFVPSVTMQQAFALNNNANLKLVMK